MSPRLNDLVRMKREPFIYGMRHEEPIDDPQLGNKRNQLIVDAAKRLQSAKMVRFDESSQTFVISDLGRIAAKYYLRYQTMEIFSASLTQYLIPSDTCRQAFRTEDEER